MVAALDDLERLVRARRGVDERAVRHERRAAVGRAVVAVDWERELAAQRLERGHALLELPRRPHAHVAREVERVLCVGLANLRVGTLPAGATGDAAGDASAPEGMAGPMDR